MGAQGLGGAGEDGLIVLADCPRSGSICVEKGGDRRRGAEGGDLSVVVSVLMINSLLITAPALWSKQAQTTTPSLLGDSRMCRRRMLRVI